MILTWTLDPRLSITKNITLHNPESHVMNVINNATLDFAIFTRFGAIWKPGSDRRPYQSPNVLFINLPSFLS